MKNTSYYTIKNGAWNVTCKDTQRLITQATSNIKSNR